MNARALYKAVAKGDFYGAIFLEAQHKISPGWGGRGRQGRGGGGAVVVSFGNLGEGPRGRLSSFVENLHETIKYGLISIKFF